MRPFILEVCYLTGRCVATAYHDRERSEWPLPPARLYSALVATWAESEERDPAERAALEWLAGLEAPCIHASGASPRQAVPHFVPSCARRRWSAKRNRAGTRLPAHDSDALAGGRSALVADSPPDAPAPSLPSPAHGLLAAAIQPTTERLSPPRPERKGLCFTYALLVVTGLNALDDLRLNFGR